MIGQRQTRRDALRLLGAGFATGLAAGGVPRRAMAERSTEQGIVDTHVHVVETRLPGMRSTPTSVRLAPFDDAAGSDGRERLAELLRNELTAAGVEHALCMPSSEISDEDPLGIKAITELADLLEGPQLHPIGLMHPRRFDRGHMLRVEKTLASGRVKALKAYLGYFPYKPSHAGFRPYYELAAKYKVPVIFHTGDTWSRRAKLKYAHPLEIDEVAVDFPDTTFVLAHFGNPWVMDAAEVVYKNENVWGELSAFLVGNADDFARMENEGLIGREVDRIRQGLEYTETYDKFMFGSDWPLVPMAVYRDFVRRLIPGEHHAAVFRDNARKLYCL